MVVDYFRPILIAIIVLLLIFLLASIIYKGKHKLVIGASMVIVSLICTILSANYMWDIGIIADEKGMAGDPVSFVLFLFIVGLSLLNPIILTSRK
ncbi:hypothetical protein [Neobacillus niacini]|uniref:hypothetical protein n=1 Tax=Neobacillus niacini TaxID=86668 RepID=UPI0005F00A7E|nr:hypothetical protein [Neobacillus niacini]